MEHLTAITHTAKRWGPAIVIILLFGCTQTLEQQTVEAPAAPRAAPTELAPEGTIGDGSGPATGLPPGTITVALLLPLSGADAEIGRALLNAAQLALFDVDDPRLRLVPRDTGGTPEGAAIATRSAIDAGAELILGPLFSASVSAAAPIARARAITMISFSTDRSVAGDGVYLLSFAPRQQVARVVAFARGQGIERFAALVPDSPYGQTVLRAFGGTVLRVGGEVTAIEFYQQKADAVFEPVMKLANYDKRRSDLLSERRSLRALGADDSLAQELLKTLAPLETLGDLDFEAVFIPEGGALLRALSPLLPYYEIDPLEIKFLGTGLWDDPGLSLEPALIGGWFAGPSPNAAAALSKRFRETFDRAPPRIASLAYDAVALAAALSRSGAKPLFGRRAMMDRNGFAGLDGIFRFPESGVAERGLAVIEVTKKGFIVLSPAPTSFVPLIN